MPAGGCRTLRALPCSRPPGSGKPATTSTRRPSSCGFAAKPCRPSETDAARTEAVRLEADKQLNAVRGREAAHTAGAALSPGDSCLICQRQLPGDYQPPAPADPQALAGAEQAQSAAARKERAAVKKLTQAQADTGHAGRSHRDRQEATMLARDRLDQARQDAAAAIRSLTQRSWADAGPLSEKTFLAGLEAACTRLSEADAGHDDLRSSSADQLL